MHSASSRRRKERQSTTDDRTKGDWPRNEDNGSAAPPAHQCSYCGSAENVLIVTVGDRSVEVCPRCLRPHVGPAMRSVLRFYEKLAIPAVAPVATTSEGEFVEVCPQCGLTLAEAMLSGLMGCAGCFDAFEARIVTALQMMHSV